MVKQGTGGAIVNVSSEAASCGEDTRPAYAASKAGVNALMRQIALRWGKEGIRCNCVAPGITMSATAEEQMPADFKQQWLDLTTMKRFGRPEDLRSEEHTSELQSLMRISYAVFCLKKK